MMMAVRREERVNVKDEFWEEKGREDFDSDEEYEEYLREQVRFCVEWLRSQVPEEHIDVIDVPELEKAMMATRRIVDIVTEAGDGEAPEVDVHWGALIGTSLGVSIITPYTIEFDKEQLEEIRSLMPESYGIEITPRVDAKTSLTLTFFNIKQMYAKGEEKT
ncbi:MAG: hypothetical protein LUI61_06495 [Firmicutes bacterium]|nr:hypothetical protein [Bacillota bacterium]